MFASFCSIFSSSKTSQDNNVNYDRTKSPAELRQELAFKKIALGVEELNAEVAMAQLHQREVSLKNEEIKNNMLNIMKGKNP
jgi:hypothetical protein